MDQIVSGGGTASADQTQPMSVPFGVSAAGPHRPQLAPGDVLAARFTIVRFLAHGGMGEVYEASDGHLQGQRLALKTLRPEIGGSPAARQRFEREVLMAREVHHPNVCPTYDIFRESSPRGEFLFLTMKLLPGEPLSARLARLGRMTPDAAMPMVRQMAAGLDAAHRAGIVHRDFKPGNVMVDFSAGRLQVSITDFGLSRSDELDSSLTVTGHVYGTAGYIAPEIFAGQPPSPASDVYAFGVVLYETIAGVRPSTVGRGIAPPSALAPGLPKVWDRVVAGCLEYNPAKRFQLAGEAVSSLELASSASRPPTARKPISRRQMMEAGGVAAGAAAVWLGWPKLDAMLHPLPEQRYVALLEWPPSEDAPTRPLIRTVLDAIGNRLARAESALRKFTVFVPGAAGLAAPKAMSDVVSTLGANLALGVSLRAQDAGYRLDMAVFDAASGTVLRKRGAQFAAAKVSLLAERASAYAAQLLEAPADQSGLKDQDEMAKLAPAAYRLFGEAEDLSKQPNDTGLDAAIERYQRVLEAEPRFALGYADLALAYMRKFQIVKDEAFLHLAQKNAATALQYNPQSAKGVLAMAVFDLRSGDTPRAVGGFAKALQLDPGNPQILIYKARAFADQARLPEEESVYREIIRQRPNYWPAYNDLGECLYRQTRYQEAADYFGVAAAVAQRVALPLANQGTMYLLEKKYDAAEKAFRGSLERAPSEFAYSNLGSIAFQRGNYQGAVKYYSQALDLNPNNFRTRRNLADCYAILGDSKRAMESYGKAEETLTAALRVNPKPGANWATLAFLHAKLGRRADAEADLKAAEERGLDQRAQFTKAQALAVLGRKEEALNLVLQCIDRGLSLVDVELAPDLKEIRADPRYRGHIAAMNGGR